MKKNNIWKLALVACLIVLSIAGSSLAYFTDTDAKTNVFTTGNVEIALTYDAVGEKLFPGQTYAKGASIDNIGSEAAYVGAIIDIPVVNTVVGLTDAAIVGILNIPNTATMKYVKTDAGYTVYVVVTAPLAADADPTAIFTGVSIPDTWGNAEMALLKDKNITVTAYATQTVGFNNATEALTTAFATAWANYPNN